jgi:hypothetical protein
MVGYTPTKYRDCENGLHKRAKLRQQYEQMHLRQFQLLHLLSKLVRKLIQGSKKHILIRWLKIVMELL